jgi:hypothetical protein
VVAAEVREAALPVLVVQAAAVTEQITTQLPAREQSTLAAAAVVAVLRQVTEPLAALVVWVRPTKVEMDQQSMPHRLVLVGAQVLRVVGKTEAMALRHLSRAVPLPVLVEVRRQS